MVSHHFEAIPIVSRMLKSLNFKRLLGHPTGCSMDQKSFLKSYFFYYII